MGYKIEYTPDYVKKDLTAVALRRISDIVMLMGCALFAALLLQNRAYVTYALDEIAMHLRDGKSVADTVSAFCEMVIGGFGG